MRPWRARLRCLAAAHLAAIVALLAATPQMRGEAPDQATVRSEQAAQADQEGGDVPSADPSEGGASTTSADVNDGRDDGTRSSSSGEVLLLVVILAGLAITLITVVIRTRSQAEPRHSTASWRRELDAARAEGRALVDLAATPQRDEPGSGLSIAQLGAIEGRLADLRTHLAELREMAPSSIASRAAGRVIEQIDIFDVAVQNERQLRLGSLRPSPAMLAATAHDFVAARASLDASLHDLSAQMMARRNGRQFGQPGFTVRTDEGKT